MNFHQLGVDLGSALQNSKFDELFQAVQQRFALKSPLQAAIRESLNSLHHKDSVITDRVSLSSGQ
jgi:hypothetical protein